MTIEMEELKVLLQGNIDEGLKFIGPFSNFETAVMWDDQNSDNLVRDSWVSKMLKTRLSAEGKETIDQIYDTLMGNVGMSPAHVKFDMDFVSFQEVDAGKGVINFTYRGEPYKLLLLEG
jgi:hypothetical protein